jgi:hypothetical protein
MPSIAIGIVGIDKEKNDMNGKKNSTENQVNDAIVNDIRDAVLGLDYGTVTIKVHNAKIVQIEITQKKRFDDNWKFEKGGGI